MIQRLQFAAASLLVLMSAACGNGAAPDAEKAGADAGAAQVGEASQAGAPAAAGPGGGASTAGVTATHWWPNWDQRAQYRLSGDINLSAERLAEDRRRTQQYMPFVYFMAGNTPDLGVENQAFWAWLSMYRNCDTAATLFSDLTSEFGDRARGAASIVSLRSEFQQWASTQPRTLTLYMPERFGQWNTTTGHFGPEPTGFGGYAYAVNSGLFEITPGADYGMHTIVLGQNTGELRIISTDDPKLNVYCPTADGGVSWTEPRTQWRLRYNRVEQRSGAQFAVANSGPLLPVVRMSSDEAQAFVARNPERAVLYELTFTVSPAAEYQHRGDSVTKQATMVRVRILEPNGSVLAESTY